MKLDYLEEVPPSCCKKSDFGQAIIHEFVASGKPAALVRIDRDGESDADVIRTYSKLRVSAMRICGEAVSVVKRGNAIYLRRNYKN